MVCSGILCSLVFLNVCCSIILLFIFVIIVLIWEVVVGLVGDGWIIVMGYKVDLVRVVVIEFWWLWIWLSFIELMYSIVVDLDFCISLVSGLLYRIFVLILIGCLVVLIFWEVLCSVVWVVDCLLFLLVVDSWDGLMMYISCSGMFWFIVLLIVYNVVCVVVFDLLILMIIVWVGWGLFIVVFFVGVDIFCWFSGMLLVGIVIF